MIVAATVNFPLEAGFLISARNRADLDWENGDFHWRYRNRFQLQRALSLLYFHFVPYAAVEPYYVSQYGKWSTTALYVGCLVPIGKHVQVDSYYEHQNNIGKKPNKQDSEFGISLHLYFSHISPQ